MIIDKKIISIIIPIYNANETIARTLDSILKYSHKENIEIICVNDGSTDDTLSILHFYANRCDSIKIYNKKNGGASEARNFGIEEANGEYIFFVDADDYVEGNMFGEMYACAILNDLDIITSDYLNNKNISIPMKLPPKKKIDNQAILDNLKFANTHYLLPYAWRNGYRRSFINQYNIRFDTTVRYGEDSLFNLEAFLHANRIMYLDKAYYHYNFTSQGLMGSRKTKLLENLERLYEGKVKLYDKFSLSDHKQDLYIYTLQHTIGLLYGELITLNGNILKENILQINKSLMLEDSLSKININLSQVHQTKAIKFFTYLVKHRMLKLQLLLIGIVKIKNLRSLRGYNVK